jgi:hypothetical protein
MVYYYFTHLNDDMMLIYWWYDGANGGMNQPIIQPIYLGKVRGELVDFTTDDGRGVIKKKSDTHFRCVNYIR